MSAPPPPHRFRRDPSEVPNEKPPLSVFKVEGPRVALVVMSPWITTVFVHWTGVRTAPCEKTGPPSWCQWCNEGAPIKRQRWLVVQDVARERWAPQLVCVSDPALESDPMLWPNDGRLDGRILWLWKQPPAVNGRMFARLDRNDQAATVPPVEDTIATLERMWRGRIRCTIRGAPDSPPPAT